MKVFIALYLIIAGISLILLPNLLIIDNLIFSKLQSFSSQEITSFFIIMTFFGDVFFWMILTLYLWITKKPVSKYLMFGLLLTLITSFALKYFFMRARPLPLDLLPAFPSLHTQIAFTGAIILSKFYKKLSPLFLTIAGLVAFSRIFLGYHYLLDIFFGMLNGIFIGLFILELDVDKIFKVLKLKLRCGKS